MAASFTRFFQHILGLLLTQTYAQAVGARVPHDFFIYKKNAGVTRTKQNSEKSDQPCIVEPPLFYMKRVHCVTRI
jgi:hypothetical protein